MCVMIMITLTIISICRKYNLIVFSDEVYKGIDLIDLADVEVIPPLCNVYENGKCSVVVGVVVGVVCNSFDDD